MGKPGLTVGICAYNEEKNLGKLLAQTLAQKLGHAYIKEIFVVSSASTDKTDEIVGRFMKADPRVKLLIEPERRGKVSAVNIILKKAKGEIIVLVGADLALEPETLDRMARRFSESKVGMVGARPIPTNSTFPGFCSNLLWTLHHEVALRSPKCGELVAFRNKGYMIPDGIGADEAFLESRFKQDGYSLVYAPDAVVRNKGPENVPDLIKQRRRNHVLHMNLRKKTDYRVSTCDIPIVANALASSIKLEPKEMIFCSGAIILEGASFLLGAYDFLILKKDHNVWSVVESTKEIS
jgi:biofilm PGA synthesis N-glycosyltransferase PgaC